MHITWHGQYTVRLSGKDGTIVLDPYDSSTGLTPLRGQTDIVAMTNPSEPAMSNIDSLNGDPVIINTPGEYAFNNMTLHAISWHDEAGHERNIQRWTIEDMIIVHLGALTRPLEDEELQEVERTGVDVLLVPVGGGTGLTTEQALHIVSTLEPRVVIPIHFKVTGDKEKLDSVETFAKEMGVPPRSKEKKALLKASKLPQDDVETIILTP